MAHEPRARRALTSPRISWFEVTPEGDVPLMHDTGSLGAYVLDL
jgi:hypothetical protein